MVDQIKSTTGSITFNTILTAISVVGIVVTLVATLSGWVAGNDNNAHELRHVQDQLTEVQKQAAVQFERLNTKLDGKLGPDALTETQRRLSEISGRLDAIDQRQRADEERTVRMQTELESIDRSSQTLGRSRP